MPTKTPTTLAHSRPKLFEHFRSIHRHEGDEELRGMLLAEREVTSNDRQMTEASRRNTLAVLDAIEQELLGPTP